MVRTVQLICCFLEIYSLMFHFLTFIFLYMYIRGKTAFAQEHINHFPQRRQECPANKPSNLFYSKSYFIIASRCSIRCLFHENPQSKVDSCPQYLLPCIKVFSSFSAASPFSPRNSFNLAPQKDCQAARNLRFFWDSVIFIRSVSRMMRGSSPRAACTTFTGTC